MPRPRKYDYQKDIPETLFIQVPLYLKKELEQIMTKKELNDLVSKFLSEYVKNSKKND